MKTDSCGLAAANNMDICYWEKKLNQNKLNHSGCCCNLVIIILNYKFSYLTSAGLL